MVHQIAIEEVGMATIVEGDSIQGEQQTTVLIEEKAAVEKVLILL